MRDEALLEDAAGCEPRAATEGIVAPERVTASGAAALYAAIDLGTNNCRMLLARPHGHGFRVVDSFSRIVRLGEGLTLTGKLSEAAMERTIEALQVCARRLTRRGEVRVRSVATEACRRASNGSGFIERARAETGLDLTPISPAEEAALALEGCSPLLDRRCPRALVFDIGGGSTELLWAEVPSHGKPRVIGSISLPYGVVTLSECYDCDPVPAETYADMIARLEEPLRRFDAAFGISRRIARGGVQMVGTSGTVTTLGAVHLDLPRYIRSEVDGLVIDFDDLEVARRRLAGMSCEQRATIPCIGADRADLVVAGCAILDSLCRRWPVGRLRIADRGIREGLLLGMMADDGHHVRRPKHPPRKADDGGRRRER